MEHDGVHDERHKLWHHIVNVQFIQLQRQTKTTSIPKELTLTILLHLIINTGIYSADYKSPHTGSISEKKWMLICVAIIFKGLSLFKASQVLYLPDTSGQLWWEALQAPSEIMTLLVWLCAVKDTNVHQLHLLIKSFITNYQMNVGQKTFYWNVYSPILVWCTHYAFFF